MVLHLERYRVIEFDTGSGLIEFRGQLGLGGHMRSTECHCSYTCHKFIR